MDWEVDLPSSLLQRHYNMDICNGHHQYGVFGLNLTCLSQIVRYWDLVCLLVVLYLNFFSTPVHVVLIDCLVSETWLLGMIIPSLITSRWVATTHTSVPLPITIIFWNEVSLHVRYQRAKCTNACINPVFKWSLFVGTNCHKLIK